MATSPIPATCACAKPVSTPPCAEPARSLYDMLSDSEHTADTIAALAAAAELVIEVAENVAFSGSTDVGTELDNTRKLLRLIRREALALAEVISDVELACRPLRATGDVPDVMTELRAARDTIAADRDAFIATGGGREGLDPRAVPFVDSLDAQLARIDNVLGAAN